MDLSHQPHTRRHLVPLELATLLSGTGNGVAMVVLPWIVLERAGLPLERVNGIHEAVWGTAFVLGPGLGGVLIAFVGAVDALWITAVAFVLSATMVAFLQLPHAGPTIVDPDDTAGLWADTRAGLHFVRHDPLLLGITVISAVLVSVYMPIEGVLPPFSVMIAASFGIGLSYGPVGPLVNLAMQARSPEYMRGRVVGIITSTQYAAGPMGYLAVGAATARFGVLRQLDSLELTKVRTSAR